MYSLFTCKLQQRRNQFEKFRMLDAGGYNNLAEQWYKINRLFSIWCLNWQIYFIDFIARSKNGNLSLLLASDIKF